MDSQIFFFINVYYFIFIRDFRQQMIFISATGIRLWTTALVSQSYTPVQPLNDCFGGWKKVFIDCCVTKESPAVERRGTGKVIFTEDWTHNPIFNQEDI